jgi:MFS family permease
LAVISTEITIQTSLVGFALAPTIGGITAYYWSWRTIHLWIAVFAFGVLVFMAFFFPETIHPGTKGLDEYERSGKVCSKWIPVMLNPISQIAMLRSPNILAVVCLSPLIFDQFLIAFIYFTSRL